MCRWSQVTPVKGSFYLQVENTVPDKEETMAQNPRIAYILPEMERFAQVLATSFQKET